MEVSAAQYVRMSTDQQPLSIDTQRQLISSYAEKQGFEIVRTYCDEAKSGVSLRGRGGMQQLLRDVMDPECPFRAILVLDVSRWGRFQDGDEAAYHEYHCRKHGVRIEYVAESFGLSKSPFDSVMKQMKRAMAAEYSRELAVKTRNGQARVVSMGFTISTLPCVGYRRQAIGADGSPKKILSPRERKPMVTDRVVWVLGPTSEQELVRRIFQEYARGYPLNQLARDLNSEGSTTHDGGAFSDSRLRVLICNEIVRGDFTWGTRRGRRTAKTDIEALSESLRVTAMVPRLVPDDLWEAAQERSRREAVFHNGGFKKEELLAQLRRALAVNPALLAKDFVTAGLPNRRSYIKHFESMARAFEAAGRAQTASQLGLAQKSRAAQKITRDFLDDVCGLLLNRSFDVRVYSPHRLISVDGVEVKICAAQKAPQSRASWCVPHGPRLIEPHRWFLIMRLNEDGLTGEDFFLLPPQATFKGIIGEAEVLQWQAYRALDAEGLIALFAAASRSGEWVRTKNRGEALGRRGTRTGVQRLILRTHVG